MEVRGMDFMAERTSDTMERFKHKIPKPFFVQGDKLSTEYDNIQRVGNLKKGCRPFFLQVSLSYEVRYHEQLSGPEVR
jgi:hypothetical protein